jgi:hypothetical protein
MAKRTKPAADAKPGSRALRQLLAFFSHDATRVHGQDATLGQEGAAHVRAALKHLADGDAQQAVWRAVQAVGVYRRIEKLALGFEHWHDMQDLAERWKADTEWAIKQGKKPWLNAAKSRGDKFRPKLERAIEVFVQLRNKRGDKAEPSDFTLRRRAAREAGISEKSLRKQLPAYLQ